MIYFKQPGPQATPLKAVAQVLRHAITINHRASTYASQIVLK